jgi:hypothetical protein
VAAILWRCCANAQPEEITALYAKLWDTCQQISVPFNPASPGNETRVEDNLFTITRKDINERIKRLEKGTDPGPDWIKRHILRSSVREALR